jgi:hypothetical protein
MASALFQSKLTHKELAMKLSEYFEKTTGVGVLATADAEGKVNTAIYARPHFLDANDDNTLAFIMADRLCHANVQTNPHASYLFIEAGEGYAGRRLSLTKVKEESDQERIKTLRRRGSPDRCDEGKMRFLVYFRVDRVRPLIGDESLASSSSDGV